MQQEPDNQNMHPEDPPVLEGRESRQGKVYERRSRTRFLMLAGLIILVTVLAAFIYFGGGGGGTENPLN
jgi:hypothetical protein